ncbi:MAG TPA: polysaccharide deacetylase [Rhizobiales bacterium]|nr:polysaccharide deacetylase [Hyphomicrobiales bacterium]
MSSKTDRMWRGLERELDAWDEAGMVARLWLRDDDAIEATPELLRLVELTAGFDIPVTLAVIPSPAKAELAECLALQNHVDVAVHGFAHRNHAGAGEKKCELSFVHGRDVICDELARGLDKLKGLFGRQLFPMLAPPWNRIEDGLAGQLPALGFSALSAFGWTIPGGLPDGLALLNTHVDIIDWKGNRGGRALPVIIGEITDALVQARSRSGAPVGILSHHLVHDDQAWQVLQALFAFTGKQKHVQWESARSLLTNHTE